MPDEAPDTFNAANVAAKGKYAPTRTICGSSEKPYLLGQIPDDPIGDDDFSEEDKQVLQIVVTSNQTATSIKRQPMPNQPLRSIRRWIEISHPNPSSNTKWARTQNPADGSTNWQTSSLTSMQQVALSELKSAKPRFPKSKDPVGIGSSKRSCLYEAASNATKKARTAEAHKHEHQFHEPPD